MLFINEVVQLKI